MFNVIRMIRYTVYQMNITDCVTPVTQKVRKIFNSAHRNWKRPQLRIAVRKNLIYDTHLT